MRLGPVARAATGGLTRRRVQTIVIALVLLVSTAASVLALALVVDSNAPFDHAFAAQRGAQATLTASSRATTAELAATAHLPAVAAAAGPFPEATIAPQAQSEMIGPKGGRTGLVSLPPMTVVGRSAPGGPVDRVVLQSGRWPARDGEIVLDNTQTGAGSQFGAPLGSQISVANLPGKPALTIVGYATSVTGTAGGWVTPGEIASLHQPGAPAAAQMLYRFHRAGTAAAVRSDIAAVSRALPTGSVADSESYLSVKTEEAGNVAPFVPFLVAFGVLGMVMSVLITGNVVSGTVVAGYWRIGVLKSIGFSPGQVVGAYTAQVAPPALAGCAAGVLVGNVLAAPMLADASNVYGAGRLGVPAWVDMAAPAALCCLVGLAAFVPALRAGRLNAVQAIAAGRAPRTGRGYGAHRLLGRLPLPRPITIGLAGPFARPARTVLTLAAVLLGATTVIFATGLSQSLNRVVADFGRTAAEPVLVGLPGAGPGPFAGPGLRHATVHQPNAPVPTPAQAERAVTAALAAQPGLLHDVAQASQPASVAGLSQQALVTAFRGNPRWTGYALISGRWYSGPGQVDVPTHFLTLTGKAVGDTITMTVAGKQLTARIAGEVFETGGLQVFTGWQTLAAADPGLTPYQHDIALRAGVSAPAYVQALSARLGPAYAVFLNTRSSGALAIMIGLVGILTLLLAAVAGLGVLNTVLLHTRERVHDLGVFKALGMSPRQMIAMVVCWVAGTGLAAGIAAAPLAVLLHHQVLPAMAAGADTGLPASVLNVYSAPELAGLALAGAVIAVVGALLPATWAAGARTASALHAE